MAGHPGRFPSQLLALVRAVHGRGRQVWRAEGAPLLLDPDDDQALVFTSPMGTPLRCAAAPPAGPARTPGPGAAAHPAEPGTGPGHQLIECPQP